MSRIAMVNRYTNIVHNVVVYDETKEWHPPGHEYFLVPVDNVVAGPGWVYLPGSQTFVEPERLEA